MAVPTDPSAPPATASGAPRPQPRTSSPNSNVAPAKLIEILTPILALVSPTGMSQDDRREWMKAAGMALQHLPEDVLRNAVRQAMRTVDHPAKIVATVIAAAEPELKHRRWLFDKDRERKQMLSLPRPQPHMPTAEEIAEIDAIKAEYGIGTRATDRPVNRPPPRKPTQADYEALRRSTDTS